MRGGKRPGAGRPKGSPNRTTRQVREVIAAFAEANAGKMDEKLNAIEDPGKWMDCYLRALEYHTPKLGRQEVVGEDGGPVEFVIRDLAKGQ
jgi:hypothetical protein